MVTMSTALKAAFIRALRTFAQAAIAVYGAGIIGADRLVDFVNVGLLEAAAVAGLIALITFAWNLIESGLGEPIPKG